MKKLFYLMTILAVFAACHEGEDPDLYEKEEKTLYDRTVLVYISGENNLSSFISSELRELREGSKGIGNNALVVYVDDANSQHRPYIMRIHDGAVSDSTVLEADQYSSDPAMLKRVLDYTSTNYQAKEYGLVLWGHSSGWIIEDSVASNATRTAKRAYGVDTGNNAYSATGKWINIYTLNKTIQDWGHLKFIFADCCQFQCIETAYELRNATDYIIASPSEVPGNGAPYSTVTKGFFDTSDYFYQQIVDSYFAQSVTIRYKVGNFSFVYECRTPFSVIKTAEMEQLATATSTILHTWLPMEDNAPWPELLREKLIYYRGNITDQKNNIMYDMNDLMLRYAPAEAYLTWKAAFDRAVIYKVNAQSGWMTDSQIMPYVFGKDNYGKDAEVILTNARYGGVSMFIPQNRPSSRYEPHTIGNVHYDGHNASIRHTAWYRAACLSELGW